MPDKKRTPSGVRFSVLGWKDLQLVLRLQIGYNFDAAGIGGDGGRSPPVPVAFTEKILYTR